MKHNERNRTAVAVFLAVAGGVLASTEIVGVEFDDLGRMVAAQSMEETGSPEGCCDPPTDPPNLNCPCGF